MGDAVIPINKYGLTLGLDPTREWVVWGPDNPAAPARQQLLSLLPLLELPPAQLTTAGADESITSALLRFALESHSRYWVGLALGWLEAGVPATDLVDTLAALKDSPTQPQPIRHRALRLWLKGRQAG